MSEYAFLLAKIRGKLARMLELPAYEELLKGADLGTVLDRLRETPYGPHLGEGVEPERLTDRLRQGFFHEVVDLFHTLDRNDQELLRDVLARYRVENLKAILRGYLRRLPPEEVQEHLLELPWEPVDWERLLRLPGLEAFIKELPWREERARLEAVQAQVGETENPFPYETELDALYLERLIRHREQRADVREILDNRLLRELLAWAYRLKGYGRSFPEIVNLLPDFRPIIPLERMRTILEEEEGWRELRRWLAAPLAQELERLERLDPEGIARLLDAQFLRIIKRSLIATPLGMAVVIGYVYWKELELSGVIQLVERARI